MIGQNLTGDPRFYNTMFWLHFKDVRVHAPIKVGIPIYFIDNPELITISRTNENEITCFEFGSIERALTHQLRTIIAGSISIY